VAKKKEQPSFEQLLAEVEQVVNSLQEGSVPLETALELYESGFDKLKAAQLRLDGAREKLETLKKGSPDEEAEA